MRCLTNSAFLFSGPSGRRKARQKDFLLRKAKVRGSESRDLMRIGRSFGEKKQAFAPKEVSVSRKCLLLFEISPNVFRITPIVSDRRLKSGRNLSGYYSEMNKAEVIKSCV